ADPDLTPTFPGITDREELDEWRLPFGADDPAWRQSAIRAEYGDAFAYEYRTAPKAYVTLAAGQKLWSSRFGQVTSVRLAPQEDGADLDAAAARFTAALEERLRGEGGGPTFEPVK